MKLVISTDDGGIVNVDVDANEMVENLKAIVEVEVVATFIFFLFVDQHSAARTSIIFQRKVAGKQQCT
jgi:hypothetical protein